MDLINFPEVVWYQQDYSVYVLRQASRRSWRIGQKEPVNVHYLYYQKTIQEKAITLNIKKLRAALLTEGDLIEEGLVTQVEEDSLASLAKAIISQSNEKVSLESELEKLRAIGDERDSILTEGDKELYEEKTDLPVVERQQTETTIQNSIQPPPTESVNSASRPQLLDLSARAQAGVKKATLKRQKKVTTLNPNQLTLFSQADVTGPVSISSLT